MVIMNLFITATPSACLDKVTTKKELIKAISLQEDQLVDCQGEVKKLVRVSGQSASNINKFIITRATHQGIVLIESSLVL